MNQTVEAEPFVDMLRSGRLPLPDCGAFAANGSSYWLQFLGQERK